MFGCAHGSWDSRGNPLGMLIAVGLSWTPQLARPRRMIPWAFLPGGRRTGGAHRRPRQGEPAAVVINQVSRHSLDGP